MKVKVLLISILLCFIALFFTVNASTLTVGNTVVNDPLTTGVASNNVENQVNSWGEDGTGETISNSGDSSFFLLDVGGFIINSILTILGWIISIIPFIVNLILAGIIGADSFSIQDLLLGKYPIFHINVFDVEGLSGNNVDLIKNISASVSLWYTSTRNLALVASAVVLLYVGIRMAISTVAEDKAKYKIMLKNWLISIALIFVLHYIMVIFMELSELLVKFVKDSIPQNSNAIGMEEAIIKDSFVNIAKTDGFDKILYIIAYFMIVYYQLKFFIIYITRVCKVAFLIMIAPLICITYPIDTISDNKAQAFNNWIKMIVTEIFLQPIHLFIYIVFIYSAGEIAVQAPIVAIMFFAALSNGEKIIRKAFKVEGKGLKDVKMPKI